MGSFLKSETLDCVKVTQGIMDKSEVNLQDNHIFILSFQYVCLIYCKAQLAGSHVKNMQ